MTIRKRYRVSCKNMTIELPHLRRSDSTSFSAVRRPVWASNAAPQGRDTVCRGSLRNTTARPKGLAQQTVRRVKLGWPTRRSPPGTQGGRHHGSGTWAKTEVERRHAAEKAPGLPCGFGPASSRRRWFILEHTEDWPGNPCPMDAGFTKSAAHQFPACPQRTSSTSTWRAPRIAG